MNRRFLAPLLFLSLAAPACDDSSGTAAPTQRFLTDDQGRALILHGVNVASSAKTTPLRVPAQFEEADAAALAERWGFNFVCYLVSWDGLEPTPGVIDTAYLDRIQTRLDWFAAHGIHVLVDMHQDVYSISTCGNGFPDWAIRSDGIAMEPCYPVWSANYNQPAVVRAFDNFWAYDQGAHADLQDHYTNAWKVLAERFRDHPAVIGYDLINEPHPGSAWGYDVGSLEELYRDQYTAFDTQKLAPFYQRCIDAIRSVDPDTYIFFEPRYGTPGDGSPSYLPKLDDPRTGDDRLVLAPHFYSIAYEATSMYAPGNDATMRFEARRREEMLALGTPLVIGEWGFDQGFPGATQYMDDVHAMADSLMAGWAYWSWDPGVGGWAFTARNVDPVSGAITYVENPNSDLIVRPYPRAVAGQPVSFSYDRTTRVFELVFDSKKGVTGPTEIYVPKRRHYPGGFVVESSDPAASFSYTFDDATEILSVTVPSRGRHTIHVRPM